MVIEHIQRIFVPEIADSRGCCCSVVREISRNSVVEDRPSASEVVRGLRRSYVVPCIDKSPWRIPTRDCCILYMPLLVMSQSDSVSRGILRSAVYDLQSTPKTWSYERRRGDIPNHWSCFRIRLPACG
jgi:hypothetical protein